MKFSDVIGNEAAIAQIRNLVDSGRMPHALLLFGEPCVPKLALAQATAQYIHCKHRTSGDSCGQCDSCIQHQTFNHADTFFTFPVVSKGGNNTSDAFLDEWREFLKSGPVENYEQWLTLLKNDNAQPMIYSAESASIIRKMNLASYSADYKVLIIWLPEKMNEECANKLLKLIEEPSSDSLFLLVSNNVKGILPTIFSRTQRIELKRPSTAQIASYISRLYGVGQQEALAIAAPCNGDIMAALQNMKLDSENKTFFNDFVQLMRLAYARDIRSLKAWSEHIADYKREKARRFLLYAVRMIRENFIYNLHTQGLNFLTPEEEKFSTRFAPFITADNVEQLFAELTRAESDIKRNANAKIVLFDMSLKISLKLRH